MLIPLRGLKLWALLNMEPCSKEIENGSIPTNLQQNIFIILLTSFFNSNGSQLN